MATASPDGAYAQQRKQIELYIQDARLKRPEDIYFMGQMNIATVYEYFHAISFHQICL